MPGALILDIPLGLGLALMAVIGSHFLEAERGLCNDMIDEGNRVGMRLFVADLERSYADRVINSAVLEPAEFFAALADEGEELDIRLDVTVRQLLIVTLCVDTAHAGSAR